MPRVPSSNNPAADSPADAILATTERQHDESSDETRLPPKGVPDRASGLHDLEKPPFVFTTKAGSNPEEQVLNNYEPRVRGIPP